ncbi:MAG TPA: flagellar motor protein MotB, partial [Nocardioidaceae bacterium]|nr:flagellar motor protein MotB [Nocardioidaceae bacterium]
MPRARRRGHAEEEHLSHERWLITYADMITLLMVLFIVLFAVSQVDQKRFEALKDGMAAGFGQTSSPFQG